MHRAWFPWVLQYLFWIDSTSRTAFSLASLRLTFGKNKENVLSLCLCVCVSVLDILQGKNVEPNSNSNWDNVCSEKKIQRSAGFYWGQSQTFFHPSEVVEWHRNVIHHLFLYTQYVHTHIPGRSSEEAEGEQEEFIWHINVAVITFLLILSLEDIQTLSKDSNLVFSLLFNAFLKRW